ncbi:MAG TPA: fumarylacetoacetate hydrolase family protein [Candidatus Limnocylindria bacterium]|jgi:2-keto-4-pentenoate hydratase/2-oxohepta-3-ene-1,7-dioic acid hydratase in catechol pathway
MRLCTFDAGEGPLTGVVDGESVLPLRDTVEMVELIRRGAGWAPAGPALPLHSIRLLAPIVPKRNVFCVGWNYAEHFAEGKAFRPADAAQEIPPHPALFSKNPFAIVGPEAAIRYPAPISVQLDYEVELAVVIGREGRDISEPDALEFVFGYTVANDVSVRDVQRSWHGGQWFKGKNFDTHLPLGPWIVTRDEVPEPQALRITTRVNGITKQDSNTKHMVFPVARIIAELSAGLTLHPGDVIITGTPEGVGMGRTPPEWLVPGDVVEVEIERIGILRNTIAGGS